MMKRSVAIRGPTPMFVRWAIRYPCPFREIFPDRLPETTFRQLRSIREVSVAKREGRIHHGICLHPDASKVPATEVFGFPVDEIVELHGGEDFIASTCRQCPAHSERFGDSDLWAGCFGWLSSDLRSEFESVIRGAISLQDDSPSTETHTPSQFDLVHLIDTCVVKNELHDSYIENFSNYQPVWYGLWHQSPLSDGQLQFMERLLEYALSKLERFIATDQPGDSSQIPKSTDLTRFAHAIRASRQYQLPLHIELVPQGLSDGVHWRILPHCQNCKFTVLEKGNQCPICRSDGRYQNEIKLKVLGVRPYLNLSRVIGIEKTERLVQIKG